ncbi:prpE protein, partial [Vibrio cholerae O1 str. PCS-023]
PESGLTRRPWNGYKAKQASQ